MSYNISIALIDQTKTSLCVPDTRTDPLRKVPPATKMQIFGRPIARSQAMPLGA